MIPRVLEPEVMDSSTDAFEYDVMDHAAVNTRFVDDLLALEPNVESVLDLATGTAQIPIELCRRSADAQVRAVDASPAMLDLAQANLDYANLTRRICLDVVDAKELPYADGSFSAVISNSLIHHVAEPGPILREAVRVVRPGGHVFFRDLLRPDTTEEVARLVNQYAADADDRQRQLFDDSLHAALTIEELQGELAALGLDPAQVRQTSDRHWTFSMIRPS